MNKTLKAAIDRRQFVRNGIAAAAIGWESLGIASAEVFSQTQKPAKPSAKEQNRTAKGRVVTLEAKPAPISINTASTAVIVVDMQNDFGSRGGMFDRAGINISMIQSVVEPTARVLASARHAGLSVVYLKMGFRPDLSDLGSSNSANRVRHRRMRIGEAVRAPNGAEGRILIRDTWNTDIVPELKPQAEDVVIYKHRFSGFYQTDLDAILKNRKVKHLIFTGCTTSVCVESTLRDAMYRDYLCVLLADCTAEPIGYEFPRSNHEASLLTIQELFGWVSISDDFTKAFETHTACATQGDGHVVA